MAILSRVSRVRVKVVKLSAALLYLLLVSIGAVVQADPKLETGKVSGLSSGSWVTVTLPQSYTDMIVVATPIYSPTGDKPAVTRIRNITSNSFEIKVQNPSDDALSGYEASYVVAEAGVYTEEEHGIKLEAVSYNSTTTYDAPSNWNGDLKSYQQSYLGPTVIGQVMSYNDEDWSTFFSRGAARTQPATSSALFLGKHVSEETNANLAREDETIGYIVFERTTGTYKGNKYEAGQGSRIGGVQNNRNGTIDYQNTLDNPDVVASHSGVNGTDGGWAHLNGSDPISDSDFDVAIDEDQIANAERSHTYEYINFFAMENSLTTQIILNKVVDNREVGTATVSDFPLAINGDTVVSGEVTLVMPNTTLVLSETNLVNYTAGDWSCEDLNDITTDFSSVATNAELSLEEGASVSCTITNVAKKIELSITKTVSHQTPAKGETITFAVTVGNSGPDIAEDVVVSDVVPSGFSVVDINDGGVESPSNTIQWTDLTIPVGEEVSVTFTVVVQ
jgi:uncharacterized repeat protein (TIGR01451 family)